MTDQVREADDSTAPRLPELVIITGMSGAGRSTAANVLEDLGWFVVDNLPPALLPTLTELGGRAQGNVPRMAAVVDVRSRSFFADLTEAFAQLTNDGINPRIIFLEAQRRGARTPVTRRSAGRTRCRATGGSSTASPGSASCCGDLRADADIIIDTSDLNVHELSAKVLQAFEETSRTGAARHAHLVRLQVRPAGRRRPGRRLPVPAQPALGARAATARPAATRWCATTCCSSPARRSSSTATPACSR